MIAQKDEESFGEIIGLSKNLLKQGKQKEKKKEKKRKKKNLNSFCYTQLSQ